MTAVRRIATGPHFQVYAASESSVVGWRLLSGNNRDLGRGPELYADVDGCRQAILDLLDHLDECRGSVRPAAQNRWAWTLKVDGIVRAVSGHNYDRQLRCEQARLQFVNYARSAPIDGFLTRTAARRAGREVRLLESSLAVRDLSTLPVITRQLKVSQSPNVDRG
ncbi:hypothetical protein ACSMXN_03770 [Jatrophihabitans sp. DSM 45814]